VIAARGAAAGAARLLGATVVTPDGATGRPDTDLTAKARASAEALRAGAARVVVHVGAPDEAAHERDQAAKSPRLSGSTTSSSRPSSPPFATRAGPCGSAPDHGCDPRTGEHDAAPVPCVTWPGGRGTGLPRLCERAVAALPVLELAHAEAA